MVAQARASHLPPEKRSIGYVAQEGALYPHLSVAENVAFGLPRRERKSGRRVAERARARRTSERGYAARRPTSSPAVSSAASPSPERWPRGPPVVLLDEPFSGLDAALRAETREAVLHALAAQGTTAVLVTHDQAEALSMGREVGGAACRAPGPDRGADGPVPDARSTSTSRGSSARRSWCPATPAAAWSDCALGELPADRSTSSTEPSR